MAEGLDGLARAVAARCDGPNYDGQALWDTCVAVLEAPFR